LSKSFGPTQALVDVDVEFVGGTVHTVLGENGSGKSTLVKALSGVVVPDSGTIEIDGSIVSQFAPRIMQLRGIETVFQEVLTAPNRSIVENVYLGYHGLWRDRLSRAAQKRSSQEILELLGAPGLDVRQETGTVPLFVQQLTVIARALVREPRALILDEATAALGLAERNALFEIIRELRDRDVLVVFVSHRMDEILEISDRVTVLRNGSVVDHVDRDHLEPSVLLRLMAPLGV